MIIECPKCKMHYRIDMAKVPTKGAHVRCRTCQTTFFVPGSSKSEDITAPAALGKLASTFSSPNTESQQEIAAREEEEVISKLPIEEFVWRAIINLREPSEKGIRIVHSGFAEAFREYYGLDPEEEIRKLAQEGKVIAKKEAGEIVLYLPQEVATPYHVNQILNSTEGTELKDKQVASAYVQGAADKGDGKTLVEPLTKELVLTESTVSNTNEPALQSSPAYVESTTNKTKIIKLRVNNRRLILATLVLLVIIGIAWWSYEKFRNPTPRELYDRISSSVFMIEYYGDYEWYGTNPLSIASGIAIREDELVTNAHAVLEFPGLVRVRQGEKKWRAFVSHLDRKNDLCTLKVPTLQAKPAKIDPSIRCNVGDKVFAIGAPKGLEMSLSDGLISGLRKSNDADGVQVIQTTAAISPGSSGGGLFNARANLIGITTAYLEGGQNLNFAIPMKTVAEAISLSREKQNRLLTLGIACLQAGYPDKAQEFLEKVVSLAPKMAEAWYVRSLLGIETLAYLQEAVRLSPDFAEANYHLALSFFAQAYEELLEQLQSEHSEDRHEYLHRRLYALKPRTAYKLRTAKDFIRKALETNRQSIDYFNLYAKICLTMKSFDEALSSIRKALILDRSNLEAHNNMADYNAATEADDFKVPETQREHQTLFKTEIETRTKIASYTPKGSRDCDLLRMNSARLALLKIWKGQSDQVQNRKAQMEMLTDLITTLEGKEKIEREKDRAEARSALIKMGVSLPLIEPEGNPGGLTIEEILNQGAESNKGPEDDSDDVGGPSFTGEENEKSGPISSKIRQEYVIPSINYRMVYIPPGTFMMGSPLNEKDRYLSWETLHQVTLTKGLYLGVTEVTIGQWRAFVKRTGYKSEAETGGGAYVMEGLVGGLKAWMYWDNPGFRQTESHPVTCVSWNDAKAFIQWLNQEERETYRLPTEAEWEYACRAGSKTRFYFGDDEGLIGKYVWYYSNSGGGTHPVAGKSPNAWGFYDMHGNVWEWCDDRDREVPSFRVLRGGGWSDDAGECRSAKRIRFQPEDRWNYIGFRLARTE